MAEKGIARVDTIYRNRDKRVRELKSEGRKIIGYLCSYPPLEMITALDFIPFRVLGDTNEAITKADAYLSTIICPFLRSALDLGLKERYDFLDGFVGTHVCDCGEKLCHLWDYYLEPPYYHFIDIPHVVHRASFDFLKAGLNSFKITLEKYAGGEITRERLKHEISLHNQQRTLIRELYELRKVDPPLITGSETLKMVVSLMSIPVEESNELVTEVIREVKERKDGPQKKGARLLVWGSPITDAAFIEMIEEMEANVVMDDICVGSRHYWPLVELTEDPLDGVVHRYLADIRCPRTFRDSGESYHKDLEARFRYLRDFIEEWKIDGVILQSMKYCDTHGYEVPALRDYLNEIGVPNLYLEHEYSLVALAPLRTRVQGFLEILG